MFFVFQTYTYQKMFQIVYNGKAQIADVHFYFYLRFNQELHALAIVSLFSPPNASLWQELTQTVYLCEHPNDAQVISIKTIKAVVSMFPDMQVTSSGEIIQTNKFSLFRHPFVELASQLDSVDDGDEGVLVQ